MEDLLNQALFYFDNNILVVSLLTIILLNIFLPASLVIIFFVGMYGLQEGIFYSYVILLLASSVPFFFINILKIDNNRLFSYLKIEDFFQATKAISVRSNLLVRLTSLPYLIQNILCSLIETKYSRYLLVNIISLIPWMIGFGLFADSLKNLRLPLLVLSLLIIVIFYSFVKKKGEEIS